MGDLVVIAADDLDRRIEAAVARVLARHAPAQPAAPPRQAETIQATAVEIGVHVATVRRMLRDGRLRGVRTGAGGSARVLVSRASIDALITGGRS